MAKTGGDGSIILTTEVDQGGLKKGMTTIGKTARSVGSTIAKSFAAIGVAAAAATVAITKMAVSAYADYEQLVGGVETLFKGSAQKVIDYANDAFYTAGISANEYMENVTAFSASLLSSLGGDTEKAADVANAALISIADNANKMGSAYESVQMAFQGFAKQQYMLLDNLKLGYGGTKTEMERLLRDAEAYRASMGETVQYEISNLADVYTAIGDIQEKLGIAGTTALEAEKTITGSANMMKASWQNVLAAISGGGDLDRAINNLVFSVSRYFENIVPVVQRSLLGIGRLIEQVAPLLVQNVASALIQSIPSLLNAVYQMIVGLAKGIWQGIKALFTGGSGSVTADIKTSVGGIAESAGQASTGMEELGDATEKAGKQANKTLAAFDDLNIISSGASGGATSETPEISASGVGGVGDVASEMSIVPEDEAQTTFLDEISSKLQPIKEAFESGFWLGFQNADFTPVKEALSGIGESLQGIFTSPEVQGSAQGFVTSISTAFGQVTGSVASIGTSLATNLVGGVNQYLSTNSAFIQEKVAKIFDASSGIATAVGNMWTAFANIFSVFASTDGQTLTANVIGIFSNAWLGITTLATQIGEDFINFLTLPIVNNQESLRTALEGTVGVFADIAGSIKSLVDDLVDKVIGLYEEHISPLIQTLTEVVTEWVGKLVEGYNKHIKPVLDQFGKEFNVLVEERLKPMFEKIMEYVGNVADIMSWLWDNILKPIGSWIIGNFTNVFSNLFGTVKDVFMNIVSVISGAIENLFTIFNGIIDFIVGVFTGDWQRAWDGLKGIFIAFGNGIITGFEYTVNMVITAINSLIGVVDNIVGAVGNVFGKDWNVPKVSKVSFPRLAQGAVIPPNREFLAVLGDQKRGVNIEAPLQTIVDAFNTALIQNGMSGGKNTEVVLEIDGREFGRAVVEQGNRENRRIGTRLVIA